MPPDAPEYREAVTERLDDELSRWQSAVDSLRLRVLEEGTPALTGLQAGLERLEAELQEAKHQWQRMKDAGPAEWGAERNTLMVALGRIQRSIYELHAHRRRS